MSHAAVVRFLAIPISDGRRTVLISGDSLETTLRMDLSGLSAHIAELQPCISRAAQGEPMGGRTNWPYEAKGGMSCGAPTIAPGLSVFSAENHWPELGGSGDCLRIPRWGGSRACPVHVLVDALQPETSAYLHVYVAP